MLLAVLTEVRNDLAAELLERGLKRKASRESRDGGTFETSETGGNFNVKSCACTSASILEGNLHLV